MRSTSWNFDENAAGAACLCCWWFANYENDISGMLVPGGDYCFDSSFCTCGALWADNSIWTKVHIRDVLWRFCARVQGITWCRIIYLARDGILQRTSMAEPNQQPTIAHKICAIWWSGLVQIFMTIILIFQIFCFGTDCFNAHQNKGNQRFGLISSSSCKIWSTARTTT